MLGDQTFLSGKRFSPKWVSGSLDHYKPALNPCCSNVQQVGLGHRPVAIAAVFATPTQDKETLQTNTASAQLADALARLGIALLSAPHVATAQLQEVLSECTSEANGAHLVYHSRKRLPPAVSVFIVFAAKTIEELALMQSGSPQSPSSLNK